MTPEVLRRLTAAARAPEPPRARALRNAEPAAVAEALTGSGAAGLPGAVAILTILAHAGTSDHADLAAQLARIAEAGGRGGERRIGTVLDALADPGIDDVTLSRAVHVGRLFGTYAAEGVRPGGLAALGAVRDGPAHPSYGLALRILGNAHAALGNAR